MHSTHVREIFNGEKVDWVIVGGGPAGCVLAHRLSADPDARVVLLEAGSDYSPGEEPWQIRDTFGPSAATDPRFLWPDVKVNWAPHANRQPKRYEQGRVIGGGSSVNGMWAIRGHSEDYDAWAEAGAEGWGWDEMLPRFRRIERDLDYSGDAHGGEGRIPVRRHTPDQWPPLCRALCEAATTQGYSYVPDMNGDFQDGWAPVPMNSDGSQRVSAAMAYLDRETRSRSNLLILGNADVRKVLFDGRKAIGVVVRLDGMEQMVRAKEVVLCAGAFQSPTLLMRSGVGPGSHLQTMGIPVVRDLPGVGRNLHDHPYLYLGVHLKRNAMQDPSMRPWVHSCLRFSSGLEGCASGDMILTMLNKTMWHALGQRVGAVGVSLYKSFTRGQLKLDDRDPDGFPLVDFNLLTDPRDLKRMAIGVRLAWSLLQDERVKSCITDVFAASYSDAVRRVTARTRSNGWKASAFASLLDGPASLRRLLIDRFIAQGERIAEVIDDDDALSDYIIRNCAGVYHPVGTCRMGSDSDPMAVLDPHCRVRGVENLRVVDASVMPSIPRANTHFPVLAIAERAADLMVSNIY